MPDEPVGVKLTFYVDPRQKRNLLSVGLLRKRTLIISYQRPLNLSVWGYTIICCLTQDSSSHEPSAEVRTE